MARLSYPNRRARKAAKFLDYAWQHGDDAIDIRFGIGCAKTEPNRVLRAMGGQAHRLGRQVTAESVAEHLRLPYIEDDPVFIFPTIDPRLRRDL